MALVALSVIEQRYRAVMAVFGGAAGTEGAAEVGVSRQSLHTWIGRTGRRRTRTERPWRSRRSCASCAGRIRSGALGSTRAGQTVRFWASVDVIHLTIAGGRVKSLRSHLST